MYPYQQFKLTYPSQVTSSNANHLFLSSRVTCTPKSFKVVLKSSSENLVLSLANFSKKFLHDVMTSESSSCKWSTQLCEGFVYSFLFLLNHCITCTLYWQIKHALVDKWTDQKLWSSQGCHFNSNESRTIRHST